MELSDDEIPESDVEFRELDLDPRVELSEADRVDRNLGYARQEERSHNSEEGQISCEQPEAAAVHGNAELKEELAQSSEETPLAPTQPRNCDNGREGWIASDEYLESIKQVDQSPMASRAKGGGKWKKRKRRNPFISFFLSMYSRRPRQRVAEVARQAGRHWGRMSDSQRKLYADQLRGFQH